ncbi:hypothetical protein GCM10027445_55590 [Amycolatopsis endophytica]
MNMDKFGTVRKSLAVYGAFGVAVLVVVVALAVAGQEVSGFMWGRACGMVASAAVTWWLAGLAGRGSRSALVRVRIISVVVPVAIVVIDGIPGALPLWFAAAQIAGALALVPAAVMVNRPVSR